MWFTAPAMHGWAWPATAQRTHPAPTHAMDANSPLDQQRQFVRDFAAADKARAARESAAAKQHAASEATAQQQYAAAEKAAQQQHAAAEQQATTQRNQAKSQLDSAVASIDAAHRRAAANLTAMQVDDLPPALTAAKSVAPFSVANEKPLSQLVSAAARISDLRNAVARALDQWQKERKRKLTLSIVAAVAAVILIAVSAYLFQQWSYDQRLAGIYQAGKAALEAEEWQIARGHFNNVLALEPEYEDAQTLIYESYYRAGKVALEAEEWQTARDNFNELLRLEPEYQDTQTLINQYAEDMGSLINPKDGATYVYVPAGEFIMGSPEGEGDSDERPQHAVTLDAFWIMQTEVTNAQYAQCVAAGVCSPPNNNRWQESQYAEHPVVNVTWQQANDYAAWAGGRLPTEAEWEKACRGTDQRAYPWGDAAPTADLANFNRNVDDTTPVGSYPAGASPFGALDMAGNVYEWTADWYAADYYSQSPAANPTGPASGTYHVLRGGSYYTSASGVGCGARYYLNFEDGGLGFRVVASPLAVGR